MNNRDIDIFIISYNRLSYLKRLVEWLENAGFEKMHIVDNASTYPPLLEYLSVSKHQVYRMDKNYGHLVIWESGKFKDIIDKKNYIVTDCDILPVEECPLDVGGYFLRILEKYQDVTKVGFALKIDDLPDHNSSKSAVIEWEKQFWEKTVEAGIFEASIDTTFALYRPGVYPTSKKWWKSIRTDHPYIARHLPWYTDTANPSDEDIFYQNILENKYSFWSVGDPKLLKEYNAQLLAELEKIYSSTEWKVLQLAYRVCNFVLPGERFGKRIGRKNKPPADDLSDLTAVQEYNKRLVAELGSITSSDGWRFLKKFKKYKIF